MLLSQPSRKHLKSLPLWQIWVRVAGCCCCCFALPFVTNSPKAVYGHRRLKDSFLSNPAPNATSTFSWKHSHQVAFTDSPGRKEKGGGGRRIYQDSQAEDREEKDTASPNWSEKASIYPTLGFAGSLSRPSNEQVNRSIPQISFLGEPPKFWFFFSSRNLLSSVSALALLFCSCSFNLCRSFPLCANEEWAGRKPALAHKERNMKSLSHGAMCTFGRATRKLVHWFKEEAHRFTSRSIYRTMWKSSFYRLLVFSLPSLTGTL